MECVCVCVGAFGVFGYNLCEFGKSSWNLCIDFGFVKCELKSNIQIRIPFWNGIVFDWTFYRYKENWNWHNFPTSQSISHSLDIINSNGNSQIIHNDISIRSIQFSTRLANFQLPLLWLVISSGTGYIVWSTWSFPFWNILFFITFKWSSDPKKNKKKRVPFDKLQIMIVLVRPNIFQNEEKRIQSEKKHVQIV